LSLDPVAPSDLVVAYLEYLTNWLIARNRHVPEDVCASAAEDAILALIKNPRSYDPTKKSLTAYLRMSAHGDFLNLLKRDEKHRYNISFEIVEESPESRNYLWDEASDPATKLEQKLTLLETQGQVVNRMLANQLNAQEEAVLKLMIGGERKTEAFANVMGINEMPIEHQRRAVKQIKDRLKKRIDRSGDQSE
jgi:RNA polymerase sigma factor (sigma-70 family)